jgi:hypothetical protein
MTHVLLSFQDRIIDASKMDEFFRQYSQLVEEHQIPQISSSTWMKHSKLSGRLFESCFNQLIAFSSEITRGAGGTYHIALLWVVRLFSGSVLDNLMKETYRVPVSNKKKKQTTTCFFFTIASVHYLLEEWGINPRFSTINLPLAANSSSPIAGQAPFCWQYFL